MFCLALLGLTTAAQIRTDSSADLGAGAELRTKMWVGFATAAGIEVRLRANAEPRGAYYKFASRPAGSDEPFTEVEPPLSSTFGWAEGRSTGLFHAERRGSLLVARLVKDPHLGFPLRPRELKGKRHPKTGQSVGADELALWAEYDQAIAAYEAVPKEKRTVPSRTDPERILVTLYALAGDGDGGYEVHGTGSRDATQMYHNGREDWWSLGQKLGFRSDEVVALDFRVMEGYPRDEPPGEHSALVETVSRAVGARGLEGSDGQTQMVRQA